MIMLPAKLVGSVVTRSGCKPFVLDTPTGQVELGRYAPADSGQRTIPRATVSAIERQVRERVGSGVREVRVGAYRCEGCRRWVDVVRDPSAWAGSRCARCS